MLLLHRFATDIIDETLRQNNDNVNANSVEWFQLLEINLVLG